MSGDLGMDLTVGLQKMRDVLRRHASPLVPLADELIDRVGSSEFYQRPPASGPLDVERAFLSGWHQGGQPYTDEASDEGRKRAAEYARLTAATSASSQEAEE